MRTRLRWITLLGAGLLAWPAFAQSPEKPADEPPAGDPAIKQKLLDNFDTNKDGTIDRAEAREIGRALREHFDIGPPGGPGGPGPGDRPRGERRGPQGQRGRGPEGDRADRGPRGEGRGPGDRGPGAGDRGPRGRGPEGRGPEGRGPEGRGREGFDGPPSPPNPERLFNRFDKDQDGSLSKDEFKQLTQFIREHRPGPEGWRGGRGRGGEGPRGEGRGGEGRGRRPGPPGPPPGPESPPPVNPPENPI